MVNGQKVWTTNAQHADRILLLARTSERRDEKPLDGLTLFFTAFDRAKLTVRKIDKLGRAAVDSNEVFIDGLEVPDEDVVGEVGRGDPQRRLFGLARAHGHARHCSTPNTLARQPRQRLSTFTTGC